MRKLFETRLMPLVALSAAVLLAVGLLLTMAFTLRADPGHFSAQHACISEAAVVRVIELSGDLAAQEEFWAAMQRSGTCKNFPLGPAGLAFYPREVMAEMRWGDGDLMYVVRGISRDKVEVFTWIPASEAKKLGVPPLGTSEPLGLNEGWREQRA